jgi:signal transduction histidine kinase
MLSGAMTVIFACLHPELVAVARWSLQGKRTSEAALHSFSEQISLAHDRVTLEKLLARDLPSTLGARGIILLTRQAGISSRNPVISGGDATQICLPVESGLAAMLAASGRPMTLESIRRARPSASLTEDETNLLTQAGLDLLVPLIANGVLEGVIGIGPKLSDDAWNIDDLHALAVLARQAGAALQNLHLLDDVRAGRDELARAHRRLLVNQDYEQRKLAQEIHDGPVQQLLGTSYRLAQLQSENLALTPDPAIIREEVLAVASELRDLIGQLRPAGLTELGLAAALCDYVGRLRQTSPRDAPRLRLHLEPKDPCLSPEVDLCLFRCTQEGVRNALRHARATNVVIELRVLEREVQLTIEDNGIGFQVPHRLSELAQHDHFGLVGAAERVEWLGGRLHIVSELGAGTTLRVTLPLSSI